ncbi:hypothetical protein FHETE_6152 [Fusarium heterosporum]|uniref:Uncharacterized protein n=1 Tax=Fusarium heterosporum TaxID=42747 RepID=A0A8H5TBA9_FUSHE|nr:hypothetical protein FHETE_6152 [Fusarium heterosporum]
MASAQEAEQIIRELTGGYRLENIVHDSATLLLQSLLGWADEKLPFISESCTNSISFEIHPKHIVVNCNDTNITKDDLEGILKETTVKLSPFALRAAIFRRIVAACERLHVQSGNFSLEFRHNIVNPENGGLRPIWVPLIKNIPDSTTRMAIHFHDHGDGEDVKRLQKTIFSQFENLDGICLLFLRRLQDIKVAFYNENGVLNRSKRFSAKRQGQGKVFLSANHGTKEESNQNQLYHIVREGPVVLAFPLTSQRTPYILEGSICTILPFRKSQYSFHIHANFALDEARQDIRYQSSANDFYHRYLADAFIQAIQDFCDDPNLCYHWPIFLPQQPSISSSFWAKFDASIYEWISKNPILRSRNLKQLRLVTHVAIPADCAKGTDGNLLLDDPKTDPFVSEHYTKETITRLEQYGLCVLGVHQFIDLIALDLESDRSKMRDETTKSGWHSAVAVFLSNHLNKGCCARKIRSLTLIPLTDGKWTSLASGPVVLTSTFSAVIPQTLGLRVVRPPASRNPERYQLFKDLGATDSRTHEVENLIFERFKTSESLPLAEVKSYLHYLYLTRTNFKDGSQGQGKGLKVLTTDLKLKDPYIESVYLPGTDHPWDPERLLAPRGEIQVPSFSILHSGISCDAPGDTITVRLGWKRWLCDFCGVRQCISYLASDNENLSDHFLHVFNHVPESFLEMLNYICLQEPEKLREHPKLVSKIKNLPVDRLCKTRIPLALQDTWLPVSHLKSSVRLYMELPNMFPFLDIEEGDVPLLFGGRYLPMAHHLSIGKTEDVDFFLKILSYIGKTCPGPISTNQASQLINLYLKFFELSSALFGRAEIVAKIREFFNDFGVLVPHDTRPTWTSLASCVWKGPPDMMTTHSLRVLYANMTPLPDDRAKVEQLLHGLLEIRNATVEDLMTELKSLSDLKCGDTGRILGVYRYLNDELDITPEVRASFQEIPLIFAKKQGSMGWFKISDCVWSTAVKIHSKANLAESYGELKKLFVDKLGVESSLLRITYDELKQSPQCSVKEIKDTIELFNSYLSTRASTLDPEPLKKAKIFPVKYLNGTVALESLDVDFIIRDEFRCSDKFQGRLNLLDFGDRETRRLKPLFGWLQIQDRYSSRRIEELTSIPNDVKSIMSSETRYFRRRYFHILRLAAAFDSPRFLSDPFLLLKQNGYSLEQQHSKTSCQHLNEHAQKLIIYVPKKPKAKQICFSSAFPRRLAAWLMEHPKTHKSEEVDFEMVNALTSIIGSGFSVIDEIFYDLGISNITLKHPDGSEEAEETWSDTEDDVRVKDNTQDDDSDSDSCVTKGEGEESDPGFETANDHLGADTDSEDSSKGSSTLSRTASPTPGGSDRSELPDLKTTLPLRQFNTSGEGDPEDHESSPGQVQTVDKVGNNNDPKLQEDEK